jgi:hypothetical protein
MQINGVTTSSAIPMVKTTSYPAETPASEATDSAALSSSASSFSSYVNEASQQPEVRGELVDSYRSRIQAGHYPSQEAIAGLTKLIGGPIMSLVNSGSSSDDSSSDN